MSLYTKLSVYRNAKDTTGATYSFDAVAKRIRDGKHGLAEKTRICNALAENDPDAYKKYKERELPAVIFAGTFPKGKRRAEHLQTHSGHVVLDIDDPPPNDIPLLLSKFAQHPHVKLAFISPSGASFKVVCVVDPVPANAAEHKATWQACVDVFQPLAEEYGFKIDPSGKDVNRLCFLAHDPQAILHPEAIPIQWDRDAYLEEQAERERQFENAANTPYTGDIDITALDSIDPNDLDYNKWLSVITACKSAGLTWQQADAWSRRGDRYQPGEVQQRWNGLHDVSWGAVVNLAKENGYQLPQRQKTSRRSVKLTKNVVSVLTETIQQCRDFLKTVFGNNRIKFFGLRADTGVGKSQAMIDFLMHGFSGLLTVPTTELAKELEQRLDAAEVNGVFRYRGILSNPDGVFPDENPCIHAVRYDAIASRGWNAYQLLCEQCEVREVCEESGYRSQARRSKNAQVTVMPFPSVFLNPAFRTLAKEFLPTYSDDLILHDEFNPFDAFVQIDLPKSRLIQLRDDWKGFDPSAFAKELLRILEIEGDLSLLRPLIAGLTDSEYHSILEGFTSVMFEGRGLSREDAHRCNAFRAKIHNTEQILTLPKLETEEWNLLVQLQLFFERYPRDADMPMRYENETLTFMLPPLPMKTRARMGFTSATLNETFFRRAMDNRNRKHGDVTFHDSGYTLWHPDAKVYQLRTNRNPRATVYANNGAQDNENLLSATGDFYWNLLQADLRNENRGLITYKALLEEKATELEGLQCANFGGLVGLDTHFKDVDVLHVLFSPELPPSAVEFKAKTLWGDDTEPLNYDRSEDGQYIDPRLQQCYEDGVVSELTQAVGRGRLVSRPVTIVVWCSHFLPGITDRTLTRLFDETDWQNADGLQDLDRVIAERENAEKSGDVVALAEATGVSERTAYRNTAEVKKQSKADRDADICQRFTDGQSKKKIATEMSISRDTVKRVLENTLCVSSDDF
ncbi:PriCT-2 domain-containing protein [Candidatus Poribacteria bacterium]|nr:PriCT-2 domain-containing protein [Candidatus Poribacteria bacterium]